MPLCLFVTLAVGALSAYLSVCLPLCLPVSLSVCVYLSASLIVCLLVIPVLGEISFYMLIVVLCV